MNQPPAPPRILVVAGSDPTAGAGLQADLKTIHALGGYALTVVTAVTVQNTVGVRAVHPVDPDTVADQMRITLEDIGADAIKIGMLGTAETVRAIAEILADRPDIPVVADPVLAGTGGGTLLDGEGAALFQEILLPRIDLLTPNLPEAAALTGLPVASVREMESAARFLISDMKPGGAVLVTGGHLPGDEITDLLLTTVRARHFVHPRLPGETGFHGTGCAIASALAAGLAKGLSKPDATTEALAFMETALTHALPLGKGQRLLNHAAHGRKGGL